MSWDSTWEGVFQRSDWGRYPDVELVAFTARNFYKRNRPEVRLLELGCGTGANLWFFAREGFETHGIDGSETAIRKAAQRAEEEALQFQLKCGDINEALADYPDAYFDAIYDVECLCCNDHQSASNILTSAKKLLKPGGVLYSRTFGEQMFTGKSTPVASDTPLEFAKVEDGPLKDLGFVRLSDQSSIRNLYGTLFEINALDESLITRANGTIQIHEYVLQCGLSVH